MADVQSFHTERLLPGFSVLYYDTSTDGNRIVFSGTDDHHKYGTWLAWLDSRFAPKLISTSEDENKFHFGPPGELIFRLVKRSTLYAYRVKEDGSGRRPISSAPIKSIDSVSPDGRWITVTVTTGDVAPHALALPLDGTAPRPICGNHCYAAWSTDGTAMRFTYVNSGKVVILPIRPGQVFPDLPPAGSRSISDLEHLTGARVIEGGDVIRMIEGTTGNSGEVTPGPSGTYALPTH